MTITDVECTTIELDYSPGWMPDKKGRTLADDIASDIQWFVSKLERWHRKSACKGMWEAMHKICS